MATMIGSETNVRDTLKNLASLEYDVAAAYRSAANRVDPTVGNATVLELIHVHEKRAQTLAPLIRGLGERPPRAGDWRQLKTQGRVVAGGLLGQNALFAALVENERDVHEAYERAAKRHDVAGEIADLLYRFRDDTRRHHAQVTRRQLQLE
ncbi:MAG: hypothetical protein ACOC1F_03915 [Myxococcota bacterium]